VDVARSENGESIRPEEEQMAETVGDHILASVLRAVPLLIDFPARKFWVDYDSEADVLYISFDRPQKATDTESRDDEILLRYRDGQLKMSQAADHPSRSNGSWTRLPESCQGLI